MRLLATTAGEPQLRVDLGGFRHQGFRALGCWVRSEGLGIKGLGFSANPKINKLSLTDSGWFGCFRVSD